MRVVFVNLPWYTFGKTGVRAGSRWPHLRARHEQGYLPFPFFLAYSAALLKQDNFEVFLIDAITQDLSYHSCIKLLHKLRPDLLVCETSTVTLNHDISLLKKINKDIPIVLCGPDANIQSPYFLESHPFLSYLLFGEYEFTLLDLARHIRESKDTSGIPGIIYRDSARTVINPARPLIDLDKLPWPLREGLPMERYNDAPGNMPLPSVQMIASRGCPYKCKFCLWPQVMYQGNSYRTRDVVDVANEMEYLVTKAGFKSVYFDDDTFNCGRNRMLAFCDELKKRRLNTIPWAIMARPDLMDEEILRKMKEAGLYAVKYGVESATQRLLDNIDKNMDLKKTERMIRLTEELGIKTHLTFTFGLPGETKESIRRTINFAVNLDPNSVQFSITTPFPGTAFFREMDRKGHILSRDWSEYDGNRKSVICSENLSRQDLESAIRTAYKEWAQHYIRRRYLKGQRLGLSPARLLLYHLKKYGITITAFKLLRFLYRFLKVWFLEKANSFKLCFQNKPHYEDVITVGRLTLAFSVSGAHLFWDKRELTRDEGFSSSLAFDLISAANNKLPFALKDFHKIDDTKFSLKKSYAGADVEEQWIFEVIDEKQFNWSVAIQNRQNKITIQESSIAIILSGEYRNWVDSWGEGGFYPAFDKMEVELRNPDTKIIGVRGRRKFFGALPTILLDVSDDKNGSYACARNSSHTVGPRVIEIKSSAGVFGGRVKIVEENFAKRKSR